ncbi:MAG: phage portal protein [Pseudomonadota bacterium]
MSEQNCRIGKVEPAYKAAGVGPRIVNWIGTSRGPQSTIQGSLTNLRNRSRQEHRNNPWVRKALTSLVANEVGTGVSPASLALDVGHREAIDDLWKISHEQIDADHATNFYGLEAMIVGARRQSGECFVRRRPRRVGTPDLAVPLQIQVLEGDFCPHSKDEDLSNGNRIRSGIEFNRRGQRVAYHMYPEHPGDRSTVFLRTVDTIRIPASQIIHHFIPNRPGQIRGEVDSATSLLAAKNFHEYSDTELERKKARAPFTGFLAREKVDGWAYNPITGSEINSETNQGKSVEPPPVDFYPGAILTGLPGESLDLFNADDNGKGYADYMRWQLLTVAAGYGLPYELLSGDWSKVNDRLVRAILNEFHRLIEMNREHYLVHQVCRVVRRWWMDWAVFTGALTLPGYDQNRSDYLATIWQPQAWPYVNPETDIKAAILAANHDLSSIPDEAQKRGGNAAANAEKNAEYRKDREESFAEAGVPAPPLEPQPGAGASPSNEDDDVPEDDENDPATGSAQQSSG